MSLKKLAQKTNCSVSTVSKAFSGSKEISESTKQRIFTAAKEMGVFEKYSKVISNKPVVAVLCPELCSEFYSNIVENLNNSANKKNVLLLVKICGFDLEKINEAFRYLAFVHKVDGIILIGETDGILNPEKFPLVAYGSSNEMDKINAIKYDAESVVEQGIKKLMDCGHKKIAFIGEKNTARMNSYFEDCMKKRGIETDKRFIHISSERFEKAGYLGMKQILESGERPTAVFAAYDYIAIGAMKYIYEIGLEVPKDISIIGTDNISLTDKIKVPLSSISKVDGFYDEAIDMILKKIYNKYVDIKVKEYVQPKFVDRNSVNKI